MRTLTPKPRDFKWTSKPSVFLSIHFHSVTTLRDAKQLPSFGVFTFHVDLSQVAGWWAGKFEEKSNQNDAPYHSGMRH